MPEIYVGDINIGGGGARALRNTTNFYKKLRPAPAEWLDKDNSYSGKSSNPFKSTFGGNDFG